MPPAIRWLLLGGILLQLLGLVPVLRRMRADDAAARSVARLDLGETVGSLLLLGGALLGLWVAESWMLLTLAGFVLMSAVYAVKGVRWLRARRRPAA
ncbi:hypothetical protein [Streptomyces sp. NPDC127092]|uniref:hypothetical protein n=1 Tax=Streptomyces sp. NPDC127092 TaxID=3347135 RepID=UPI00365FB453